MIPADAPKKANPYEVLLIVLFLALVGGAAFLLSHTFDLQSVHELAEFIISFGAWGPVIVIFLGILAAVTGIIPAYPLTLLAGGIWGVWKGTFYIMIGIQTGATIAFLITRHSAFPWVERLLEKHIAFYRQISDKYVTQFVFFSRLLPFFVYELISYGSGLTKISFKHYFWATFFGTIPFTLFLAWNGKVILSESGGIILALTVVSLALMLIFPFIVERYNPFNIKYRLLDPEFQEAGKQKRQPKAEAPRKKKR